MITVGEEWPSRGRRSELTSKCEPRQASPTSNRASEADTSLARQRATRYTFAEESENLEQANAARRKREKLFVLCQPKARTMCAQSTRPMRSAPYTKKGSALRFSLHRCIIA